METTEKILKLAAGNRQQAFRVIEQSNVIGCWQSVGARINLIGSLKTGLLMKHRDIDFHVYTPRLNVAESFRAMTRLAENPRIVKTEYVNLTAEEDACLEWHAWYQSDDGNTWQIDMIHMAEGCRWDGYFEKFADRINAAAGAEERKTILRLKYETPDDAKIAGIEYYMAVLRDGIENYDDFVRWRQQQKTDGIIEWMPEAAK